MDRVQVLKRESTAGGGDAADEQPWDAPIEPQEDAVEAAGLYLQDVSNRDETTLINRAGLDMLFKDGNNPAGKTLTELAASSGGGITESQHAGLDDLVHWLAETNYQEVVRSGGKITNVINWTDAGKTIKIRAMVIARSGGKVSQMDFIQYDDSGVEKQRMTGVITRTSGKVWSVQWTETGS